MGASVLTSRSPTSSTHSLALSQSSTRSHISQPIRRRARSSSPPTSMTTGKAPPSPRTVEKYARMFDHALAQRYVAALRARARAVGVSDTVPLPVLIAHADKAHGGEMESHHNVFVPRMDMYECHTSTPAGPSRRVTASLELPGLKREALRLEVHDHTLLIEGSRTPPSHTHSRTRNTISPPLLLTGPGVPPPSKADLERYHGQARQERSCQAAVSELRYGRFRRVLTLPNHVEASDIEANMEDGMLHVSWPI